MTDRAFNKAEMQAIWDEVQENRRVLGECRAPHDFSVDDTPDREVFKRFKCSKCGGVVDIDAKRWYERGLEHGRSMCQA